MLLMYDDMVNLFKKEGEVPPTIEKYIKYVVDGGLNCLHDLLHILYEPIDKGFDTYGKQPTIENHVEELEVIYIERKFGKFFTNNRDRFMTLRSFYNYKYAGYEYIIKSPGFDEYFRDKDIKGTIFDKIYEIRDLYLSGKQSKARELMDESIRKKLPQGLLSKRGKDLYNNMFIIIGKLRKINSDKELAEPIKYAKSITSEVPILKSLYQEVSIARIEEEDGKSEIEVIDYNYNNVLNTLKYLKGFLLYGRNFLFAYFAVHRFSLHYYESMEEYSKFNLKSVEFAIKELENIKNIHKSHNIEIEGDGRISYIYKN